MPFVFDFITGYALFRINDYYFRNLRESQHSEPV